VAQALGFVGARVALHDLELKTTDAPKRRLNAAEFFEKNSERNLRGSDFIF
jgi:hypothetical protein